MPEYSCHEHLQQGELAGAPIRHVRLEELLPVGLSFLSSSFFSSYFFFVCVKTAYFGQCSIRGYAPQHRKIDHFPDSIKMPPEYINGH